MKSIKELRKICQDKGYQEHVTLCFWRIFSIYITRIFLILKIKPNFVTILGFLMGMIGGGLYLAGYFLLGSLLFLFSIIFDFVDGEIARYLKLSSNFGAWLDTISAHLLYPYFFFTLGLGIFFQTGVLWYIILGAVAAMAKLNERSLVSKGDKQLKASYRFKNRSVVSTKMWMSHIAKLPVLYPIVFLCSITGWENWFLWFFAIYLTILALGKIFFTGWRIYSLEK